MSKIISILKKIYYFFSPYANPFERKVYKVLNGINEYQSGPKIRLAVEELMNENLAVMNLWLEREFKGYHYLKKSVRTQKYENLKIIEEEFKKFLLKNAENEDILTKDLLKNDEFQGNKKKPLHEAYVVIRRESGNEVDNGNRVLQQVLNTAGIKSADLSVPEWRKKLAYMLQIMIFLEPGIRFKYQESTNFGALLENPLEEVLVGDCNQIVTLYAHLYALEYPIGDLKIKLPHNHVCLHLFGVDIEATGGVFANYCEYKELFPITELIATNLLDIHDYRENQIDLSENTMLKGSRLAYHLCSNKAIVSKNLRISYHNLAWEQAGRNNFESAVEFMKKSGDLDALGTIYHNAAIFFSKGKKHKKALYYAEKIPDKELIKWVSLNEARDLFDRKKWDKAEEIFASFQEKEGLNACFRARYNVLAIKVKNVKLMVDAVKYEGVYRKMLKLAKLIGDDRQIKSLESLLNDLENHKK